MRCADARRADWTDLRASVRAATTFGWAVPGHKNLKSANKASFSSSGHLFALGADDAVRIWDIRNTAAPIVLTIGDGAVNVNFETDGGTTGPTSLALLEPKGVALASLQFST